MAKAVANPSPAQAIGRASESMRRLMEAGLSFDALQTPINDRNRRHRLVDFWNYLHREESMVKRGWEIMANNVIFPEEMARCAFYYSQEQLQHLADTFPSEDELRWLARNGYALVAGPPSVLTLEQICALWPDRITIAVSQSYASSSINTNIVGANWLPMRARAMPDSWNKPYDQQRLLLDKKEEVPNAAELLWFTVVFQRVRGVWRPESGCTLRTRSFPGIGVRLAGGRLHVELLRDEDSSPTIALTPMYKLGF